MSLVYDPRDNTEKESDNPILIHLSFMLDNLIDPRILSSDFWLITIDMANYAEEEVYV